MKYIILLALFITSLNAFGEGTPIRARSELAKFFSKINQDRSIIETAVYDRCKKNVSLRIGVPTVDGMIPIMANSFNNDEPVLMSISGADQEEELYERELYHISRVICYEYRERVAELKEQSYASRSKMAPPGDYLLGGDSKVSASTVTTKMWIQLPGYYDGNPNYQEHQWARTTVFVEYDHTKAKEEPNTIIAGGSVSLIHISPDNDGYDSMSHLVDIDFLKVGAQINLNFIPGQEVTPKGVLSIDAFQINQEIQIPVSKGVSIILGALFGLGVDIALSEVEQSIYVTANAEFYAGVSFKDRVTIDYGIRIERYGNGDCYPSDMRESDAPCSITSIIRLNAALSERTSISVKGEYNMYTNKPSLNVGFVVDLTKNKND